MATRRAPKSTLNTPFLRAPADRWRHGTERKPKATPDPTVRQAPQRVRSVTSALVASGRLRPSDHVSALRWLRDHELGVHGARSNEEVVITGVSVSPPVGGYDRILASTLDALSRAQDAARAVGKLGHSVLIAAVFESRSLTSLAAEFTPQPAPKA